MGKLDIDGLMGLVVEAERAFQSKPKALWSDRTYLAPKDVPRLRALLARVGELDARVGVLEGAVWKADGELSMIQGAVVGIASDLDRFDGASKKLGSNASRMLDSIRSRIFEGIDACARDARQALQPSSRSPPSLGVGEEDQAVASDARCGVEPHSSTPSSTPSSAGKGEA